MYLKTFLHLKITLQRICFYTDVEDVITILILGASNRCHFEKFRNILIYDEY